MNDKKLEEYYIIVAAVKRDDWRTIKYCISQGVDMSRFTACDLVQLCLECASHKVLKKLLTECGYPNLSKNQVLKLLSNFDYLMEKRFTEHY